MKSTGFRVALAAAAIAGLSALLLADGAYTTQQAERGATVFTQYCATCHGAELKGGDAAALTGKEFMDEWAGYTANDLFERIRGTMPPNDAGKLSPQEYVDALAFILRANGFPAGTTELKPEEGQLKQVPLKLSK